MVWGIPALQVRKDGHCVLFSPRSAFSKNNVFLMLLRIVWNFAFLYPPYFCWDCWFLSLGDLLLVDYERPTVPVCCIWG